MSLTITLNQPPTDNIGHQLLELVKTIKKINNHKGNKEIIFDLKKITFVHPVFSLSLSALMSFLSEKGFKVYYSNLSLNIGSYLQTIYFPVGLKPDDLSSWESILNNYNGKKYLPILNFPASKTKDETEIRVNVLTKINNLLENNLQLNNNYKSGVSYLISEITDNIVDHSGVNRGWLAAQYYPQKKYLDICIIDTGKTLLGSYQDNGFTNITNDLVAIESAIQGLSTKDRERGKGIPTSNNMIVKGLKGTFVLISGKAILFNNQLTNFPVKWNGTILALRIPRGVNNFNYINYV